jgi:uncharacterized protein YdcH (DUF465 family)
VYVSTELIAIVLSAATLMLGFAGTFGWMIHRMDAGFARVYDRIDQVAQDVKQELGGRIDGVESGLNDRIDRVEQELGDRMERVEQSVVELKVAVARIEGPQRHLLLSR